MWAVSCIQLPFLSWLLLRGLLLIQFDIAMLFLFAIIFMIIFYNQNYLNVAFNLNFRLKGA